MRTITGWNSPLQEAALPAGRVQASLPNTKGTLFNN